MRIGGWIPRARSRSSSSASFAPVRASASSAIAPSGSVRSFSSAIPRLMPSATRRAWAPSCRSRSILRSSVSCTFTAPARVSSSSSIRCAAPAVDDGGVDAREEREPESRPDRPEVAAGRDRPHRDEEAAEHGRDPDLDRERAAAEREPGDLGALEDEDDPPRDPDDEREREHRPDRPEVAARRQRPDDDEHDDDAGRDQGVDRSAPGGGALSPRPAISRAQDRPRGAGAPASARARAYGPRRCATPTSRTSPAPDERERLGERVDVDEPDHVGRVHPAVPDRRA